MLQRTGQVCAWCTLGCGWPHAPLLVLWNWEGAGHLRVGLGTVTADRGTLARTSVCLALQVGGEDGRWHEQRVCVCKARDRTLPMSRVGVYSQ